MERVLALQALSSNGVSNDPISSDGSSVSNNCSTESRVCSATSVNCGDTITQIQIW